MPIGTPILAAEATVEESVWVGGGVSVTVGKGKPTAGPAITDPALSAVVAMVAVPSPVTGSVPNTVPPSLNVTVPVALLSGEFTMAVKVVAAPLADGFPEEETAVAVARLAP